MSVSVDLYKLMCVQGVQSREVLQLVLQITPIFKQLILQISTNTLNLPLYIFITIFEFALILAI